MVKLIRLSTSDNNGVFRCNFDTDVILKENAQIALRNIVFEPDRLAFTIDGQTGEITTHPTDDDGATDFATANVEIGRYTMSSFRECLQEIANALNRTLAITNGTPARTDVFSSYRFRQSNDDFSKIEIIYRLSPVSPVFDVRAANRFFIQSPQPYRKFLASDEGGRSVLRVVNTAPSVGDERYRIVAVEGVGLSKGTGIFYLQIRNSVVNGGTPAHNGFGIGISLQKVGDQPDIDGTTNPRMDDQEQRTSIDAKAKNFEIDFQDLNTNYFVRFGGLASSPGLADSGFAPVNGDSSTNEKNDIVMIKVNTNANFQKVISGHVIQENPANLGQNPVDVITRDLFEYVLTDEDIGIDFGQSDHGDKVIFTPYLFIRGNQSNIIVQNVRFTPDVCVNVEEIRGFGVDQDIGFFPLNDDHPINDGLGLVDSGFKNHLPQVPQAANGMRLLVVADAGITSSIDLGNELGEFLGMTPRNRSTQDREYGFGNILVDTQNNGDIGYPYGDGAGIVGATFRFLNHPRFMDRDFFQIESINLNLDSYNSMVSNVNTQQQTNGDRRNILDTITDKNTGEGVIEYVPNELVYIDIKNSANVNLRNVAFRVLDHDLNPVPTQGQSNMTILIKD